jgi:putative protease
MKIVAPISRVYEVEDVINAGADEVYCGVYTKEWRKQYTDLSAPNRHPGRSASLDNFDELGDVVRLAHSKNVPVFFTINEFYSGEQYDFALENVGQAVRAGVDALIVADINLLLMIKEKDYNIQIHMGTGATTFNSQTVAFYKDLGASRVILDRQLSIEEIGVIASKTPGIEFEVFALNQKCHNIDGFCAFLHGLTATKHPFLSNLWNMKLVKRIINSYPGDTSWIEKAVFKKELGCCLNYEFCEEGRELLPEKKAMLMHYFDANNFLSRCGACALYDLDKFGIGFVKIVGREDPTAKKTKDVKFIHSSIEAVKEASGKHDFIENVRALYKDMHSFNCDAKFCYYLN